MNGIDLAKEYTKEVLKKFDDMTTILYGSTVFGINSSDLDICFLRKNDLSREDFEVLKKMTIEFHKDNKLRIDEEVPFENKLIYTYDFLEDTFRNLPFYQEKGQIVVPKITKDITFLSSISMKKRLILNILTVKHLILSGESNKVLLYEKKAWLEMIKVVISYAKLSSFSIDEIMKCFLFNPYTNDEGELYLGYKSNNENKIIYLRDKLNYYLKLMVENNSLDYNGKYLVKK